MIPTYHTGYVVDASVVVKWFMEEEDRDRALALRELHTSGRSTLFVSELTFLEILNAIRYGPRAKEEDGAETVHVLENFHLQVKPTEFALLRKANAIAWAYKITIYDALYVALAEQLGYPLITSDDTMVKKLRGHSIVVPLRELEL
ncbi:MAG: type II toxin-antitoxin system VapC family toxin [Deltaproteobacteria bacterium]|nr:type II toxin-antitoxin system VapC family toxin [Deltaproteobacteria bacterium]